MFHEQRAMERNGEWATGRIWLRAEPHRIVGGFSLSPFPFVSVFGDRRKPLGIRGRRR